MPFDPLPVASPLTRRPELKPVALWLFGLCFMVLVMVTLGGATRLTGSGLSIMEWSPIMGVLPPMSDAEWRRLFALYQQTSQYDLINHGFGLAGFKGIFWLEWTHRLWGRLMGAALFIPLVWFTYRRRIGRGPRPPPRRPLRPRRPPGRHRLVHGRQRLRGESTAVSPYRLVLHLALAVTLYAALLWTALGVWRQARGPAIGYAPRPLRFLTAAVCTAIAVTILAGGFVAGLHAGLTYNSFPFMDGHLVPEGYGLLHPFMRNLFENIPAVQFDHRLLATLTATLAAAAAIAGVLRGYGAVRLAMAALGGAVLLQYALGVITLLWAVPVPLGAAHQAMAMLALTAALVALHVQGHLSLGRAASRRSASG